MIYDKPQYLIMGDRALLIELGDEVSPLVNREVRALLITLEQNPIRGIVELVPTYRSLLILYDPLILTFPVLRRKISERIHLTKEAEIPPSRALQIPVCYEGEYGPDLQWVADYHNMSVKEVIRLHTGTTYRVYMIGFTPGYAYLGELPGGLVTPRRETPRTHVPKGSVGIAKNQTGVYPVDSPGGWQIIGRTPLELFNPNTWPPALLNMGDLVTFYAIDKKEMIHWQL